MRALVSIFAGLLILISLYQLSFTWFVNKHEKELDAKAAQLVKRNNLTPQQKYPSDKDANQCSHCLGIFLEWAKIGFSGRIGNCKMAPGNFDLQAENGYRNGIARIVAIRCGTVFYLV